ncbi:uncharacterized protein B0H18DRAFT_979280, partial [Fomitopsis serialis]|uniref:uncharacterized protein n=1 Tax=Fomitopsis serialis TaxID=139415 RepID=UPI00200756BA
MSVQRFPSLGAVYPSVPPKTRRSGRMRKAFRRKPPRSAARADAQRLTSAVWGQGDRRAAVYGGRFSERQRKRVRRTIFTWMHGRISEVPGTEGKRNVLRVVEGNASSANATAEC